ncbi:adenosylmethionine--8-amino-7-oxononanoate transaminase [Actinoplanes utahensis]|uniref:adenosylmethionine--8-amino-7-oxononanoate transaminase n=1 Tax=Actinoplanes utahensis TaxID=1869 RepID=UPI001A43AC7D|nr:adenosylmethionine--8-amino-7-oxononanoate transaminase [Actinoplanes utahensis]GIF28520.1 adenosylmethionine--8-amino-7-oxononanoate aminotransferase BioA [Actinoplanes utahensis]
MDGGISGGADGLSAEDLLALDRAHVWHPYGPMPGRSDPYLVESAEGVRLRLADGRELIDGMSSWWAAIHGYRNPVLDAALAGQAGRMSHVMFGGLTHEPAIRLAAQLVEITPDGLEHVFLCDSGSVGVEVAIKMALQAQKALGRPGRRRLATWRGGYHGDTFHPMSVCDPVGGMHTLWTGVLPVQIFAGPPPAEWDERYAAELTAMIERHADEIAAVIVEPVVQGAGGMRFHHPEYLRVLREATAAHGIFLIFDEIATGFGRTGRFFGADHAGASPDIMCLGKALTGGYLTLAATLCTREVAAAISAGEGGGLAHGPTFMGNPLACAVALASLDLLRTGGRGTHDLAGVGERSDLAGRGERSDLAGRGGRGDLPAGGRRAGHDERAGAGGWATSVPRIETALKDGLEPLRGRRGVADVRVLGAIGVVQLDHPVDMAAATAAAVAEGVWLRPFRDLIYTMPPFVTDDADLARITAGITAAVAAS